MSLAVDCLRTRALASSTSQRNLNGLTGLTKVRGHATAGSDKIWRPTTALDEWVEREARPVSLRQLTVFGRALTESRLVSSANYVRTELPTRIAHRLRDMQSLPYAVIANPSMSHVYQLYYKAFDMLRRVPEVKTAEENKGFCDVISEALIIHRSVIPRLIQGVIECRGLIEPQKMDTLVNTLLRARISRRVIAEQHLALTDSFHSPRSSSKGDQGSDIIGEVFLHCNVREVVEKCATVVRRLSEQTYGQDTALPNIEIKGHLDATLTYIPSHLEYMVAELLRNSIQAVVERRQPTGNQTWLPPIEVLICEATQHVILRVSDQGGGVSRTTMPTLWSFVESSNPQQRMDSLLKVRQMSATLQEIHAPQLRMSSDAQTPPSDGSTPSGSSLGSLAGRPANYRLGIGLPMSRVYAEYWAGSLELHSLEGYGVDAFLQLSKLGNKNERLSTRASMDAL